MITKGLIAVIIAMALFGVWQKFEISALEKDVADLQLDVVNAENERDAAVASSEALREEIALHDAQLKRYEENLLKANTERLAAQQQVSYMRGLFQDHDFANLIAKKPGLIEKRMIAATRKVHDEIESLTAE